MNEILEDLRALVLFIWHALTLYAQTIEGQAELEALLAEFADDLPWNRPQSAKRAEPVSAAPSTPEGFDPSTMSRSEWLKQQEGK